MQKLTINTKNTTIHYHTIIGVRPGPLRQEKLLFWIFLFIKISIRAEFHPGMKCSSHLSIAGMKISSRDKTACMRSSKPILAFKMAENNTRFLWSSEEKVHDLIRCLANFNLKMDFWNSELTKRNNMKRSEKLWLM